MRPRDLPLRIQVLILSLSGIVVAQVLTLLVALALPLPPVFIYTLSDVAAVYLDPREGAAYDQPIAVRDVESPPFAGSTDPDDEALAATLARALDIDRDRIRLRTMPPPGFGGWTSATRAPPGLAAPDQAMAQSDLGLMTFQPIVQFKAALQLPDGRWRVIEPAAPTAFILRLAIWLVAGLVSTGPIAWWFAHRVTRPVKSFALAAGALGRDPRASALAEEGPAEVGVAARAFNDMQHRLQRYIDDRLGLLGAISHDLRTPLTRMHFKVERLPPDQRTGLLEEITYMESMIDQVLVFVRGVDDLTSRDKVDLTALVAAAVDDAADLGRAVTFEDRGDRILVQADSIAVRRVLDNLLDNAVKYGREADVSILLEPDEVRVLVNDQGDGLPEEDLEAVFRPFDRSSRPSTGISGVGLGLTTARSIARAHGGDVVLRRGPVGLQAELRLPLAAAREK